MKGPVDLGHAIVLSSNTPLLLLDGDLKVIVASASFCAEFRIAAADIEHRPFAGLGKGEWGGRQLSALLQATASGAADIRAYEMDLASGGQPSRRLIVNAQRLDYSDSDGVRVLLSIVDITAARLAEKLKSELLLEKEVLLREVQHRVANSLQIIASILLQSARKMQSGESRTHLELAHGRVMSIASVQQQLASGNGKDVALAPYFRQLCKSLGASMILDPDTISITVDVDDSMVHSNMSASLGLIVTELVINALKHAFPGHRGGHITVDYHSAEKAWALSVRDDGIGYPAREEALKPGLGTGIVTALAAQLAADFTHDDAHPGTVVKVAHA